MTTQTAPLTARVAYPDPAPSQAEPKDYQSVLAAVTGQVVDLRGPADPQGGWLSLVDPGKGNWLNFGAFDSPLFSVSVNVTTVNAWTDAVKALDGIAHELSAGTLGLMNLQQLRDGETLARDLISAFQQANSDVDTLMDPLRNAGSAISGSAASTVLDRLTQIQTELQRYLDALTTRPAPALADTLHAAGDALTQFGQQMAAIYWQAAPVLTGAVADGSIAIAKNVTDYLQLNGLIAGSPNTLTADTPAHGVAMARQILAAYSSDTAGGLPAGMGSISGDLTGQAVWAAANAAITQHLAGTLNGMDSAAQALITQLSTAYETATQRLLAGTDLDVPDGADPAQPETQRAVSDQLPDQPRQEVQGQQPLQPRREVQGQRPEQPRQLLQEQQPLQPRTESQGQEPEQPRQVVQGQPLQPRLQLQGQEPDQPRQEIQGQQPLQPRLEVQGQEPEQPRQVLQEQQPLQPRTESQGQVPDQPRLEVQGRTPTETQQPLQQRVLGREDDGGEEPDVGQQSSPAHPLAGARVLARTVDDGEPANPLSPA